MRGPTRGGLRIVRARPALGDDLDQLTVVELRDVADSRGIDLAGLRLKSEILSAIRSERSHRLAAGPGDHHQEGTP